MKRFAILTSVLALAACGGGSGGVGDGLTPAQREAVESNKQITGMLTYIETDDSGNTLNSRSATTRGSGVRQIAGSYDLSNIGFASIDEDFEDVGNPEDNFHFVVDENKKIIGIDMDLSELDDYPEDGPEYFERVGNTKRFAGLVKIGPSWVDAELDYNSLGKDVELRYSDFGYLAVIDSATGEEQQHVVFMGGYDDAKKIDKEDINTSTTFNGSATVSVVAVRDGENSGKFLNLDTSDAKLVFNQGGAQPVSTLTANFDNWYDIEYTESGDNKSIAFSNYHNNDGDEDFRMISDTGTGVVLDNSVVNKLNSEIHYYGDNGTPSEAVGLIQMRDCGGVACTNNYDTEQEVRMNLGFGGKVN